MCIFMELYHKIYKMNPDLTVYLDNPQKLVEHCDEMLSHLTGARSMNELHGAKIAVLRDFYSVCSFDIKDADFPDPIGHFDSENEKTVLIRKKILLQDTVQYLGRVYKKYYIFLYNKNGTLPIIQLDNCMIDYNEIYIRAMEDYVDSIINKKRHAITASFALPSLIERGLGMNLQNRMLFKSIYRLLNMQELNIDIIFCKLNIRNCIMHGLGETFDYLNIGIVAIMFQLLWDVAACEIFND